MKNLLISLTIAILTISNVYGEAIELKKGSPAPFAGVLVDFDTMKAMRADIVKKDALEAENASLLRSIKLQELNINLNKKHIEILSNSNDQLYDRLNKTTNMQTWERMIWFGIGVFATGMAVKGAGALK